MKRYKLRDYQVECQSLLTRERNLVTMFMRSGKTLTMLDHAKKIKAKKVLWFTESLDAKSQLINEYKEYGFKYELAVSHYRSLKKHIDIKYDLIIFDECHILNMNHIKLINANFNCKMILMTGSLSKSSFDYARLVRYMNAVHVFDYDDSDAVDNNAISDFKITINKISLNTEKNVRIEYGEKNDRKHFYTSERASYVNLSNKIGMLREDQSPKSAKLSIYRSKFLNKLDSRVVYAKEFINKMEAENKRFLIFCEDSELSNKISNFTYNSKTSKEHLNNFQNGIINHLVLVNKGSTGLTYNNLDACLLLSVNSSAAFVLQRIFRTVLFKKDKVADINILLYKDTIQEAWIIEALSEINQEKIHYNES